ncbi:MAG: FkbM family methyltransferase [Coleofasciculus sp. B1-GNL1-01]|uniref:FkbM family methyltransferase n=1 Tax=Coleofasciculus sp. B1-GNL1-01 TaxID=3068484 RepID=UPI0032FC5EC1
MAFKPFFKKLNYSINFLLEHPEMHRVPHLVLFRLALWEIYKALHYQPLITIHSHKKMRLIPGKRRGLYGLIFIFREQYEPVVFNAIHKYCSSGIVCYDIGANIGVWSLKLSELVGEEGRVYAFEPVSKNINLLKENIYFSGLNNIEILPVGLGSQQSTCKIYVPTDSGRAALAPESINDRSEDIEIKCLDDIWESQGFPNVGFCKIDVEGSEPLVLKGGSKFFQEVRPIVCCEINPFKLKKMGQKQEDIFETFQSWNYIYLMWNNIKKDFIQFQNIADIQNQKGYEDIVFIPN